MADRSSKSNLDEFRKITVTPECLWNELISNNGNKIRLYNGTMALYNSSNINWNMAVYTEYTNNAMDYYDGYY